jgi:hypothetical protein
VGNSSTLGVSSNVEEIQIMTRQQCNGGDDSSQLEIKYPPMDQVLDKKDPRVKIAQAKV